MNTALADLQRPRPLELSLGFDGELLWVHEEGARYGTAGCWLGGEERRGAELVCWVADWLQEQFFPESEGVWGEARPVCPGHPHPAQAEMLDGAAWWICPVDRRRIASIGNLAA